MQCAYVLVTVDSLGSGVTPRGRIPFLRLTCHCLRPRKDIQTRGVILLVLTTCLRGSSNLPRSANSEADSPGYDTGLGIRSSVLDQIVEKYVLFLGQE